MVEALDWIVGGVILLDERGAPLVTNQTADRVPATNDGLALDGDGPSASTSEQTGKLRRALAGAARTGGINGEDAGAVLRPARPLGRQAPRGRRRTSPAASLRRCSIAGPRPRSSSPSRMPSSIALRSGFASSTGSRRWRPRLPRASSRERVSPISARKLGISIHTVPAVTLKQLFAETGTHRSPYLSGVLLTGLAGLRLD